MSFLNRINCFVCNTEGIPRVMQGLNNNENQHRREIAARF